MREGQKTMLTGLFWAAVGVIGGAFLGAPPWALMLTLVVWGAALCVTGWIEDVIVKSKSQDGAS